jgi:gamma-glutamyltranspeptidase/glutathione hydrolase
MTDRQDVWTLRKSVVRDPAGMVAAQNTLAATAGASILKEGGNAIDAAVATALALSAVEPWMCGLGGSGFLVAWLADERRAVALDFQGVLPMDLSTADYPPDPSLPVTSMGFPAVKEFRNTRGYSAITVPGAVAGLSHAAAAFGRREFADLLCPAISLAETGLPGSWYTTLMIASEVPQLRADPVSAAIYLPGGVPLGPEDRMRIPGLSDTLCALRDRGPADFYEGEIARRMVAELQAGGSRISLEDLATYRVVEASPLQSRHRGVTLYSPGPQSGGARQRDMLSYIQAALPLPPPEPTPDTWAIYAEALESAWRAHRARNGTLAEVGASTSSLSAADAEGNMVSITYTLLDHFGSGVTLPSLGIAMNNGVSYFDPRPGLPTTMEGGKRINSSNMCPTVAVKDEKAIFAIGASGGDLIMPCVSQIAALMIDFDMSLEDALHAPRIDASHRGSIRVDPRLGRATLKRLEQDHTLEVAPNMVMPKLYACPSGVARTGDGTFEGLNDPILPDGGAAGPSQVDPED